MFLRLAPFFWLYALSKVFHDWRYSYGDRQMRLWLKRTHSRIDAARSALRAFL